jgi:hypothetical protein
MKEQLLARLALLDEKNYPGLKKFEKVVLECVKIEDFIIDIDSNVIMALEDNQYRSFERELFGLHIREEEASSLFGLVNGFIVRSRLKAYETKLESDTYPYRIYYYHNNWKNKARKIKKVGKIVESTKKRHERGSLYSLERDYEVKTVSVYVEILTTDYYHVLASGSRESVIKH